MFKKTRNFFANRLNLLLKNPFFRYKIVLPLVKLARPDSDEEILEKAMLFSVHSGVKGDYLEFGVWKGRSFTKAFHIRENLKKRNPVLKSMRFYAFDSFQGLPQITGEVDKGGEFKKGDYYCDLKTFKKILIKNGVNINEVTIIPGWYKDTLNDKIKKVLNTKSAAIIFIDCDLYESAVSVLDFVTDYVVDGTVIIFDDWYSFKGDPNKGEQRAFREWLKKNPNIKATEWQKVNWKTNSFILNRKQ